MPINKDHWYDGWFYDTSIAPNQDLLSCRSRLSFRRTRPFLSGVWNRAIVVSVADTCPAVLGIDLSTHNIERPPQRLSRSTHRAVTFDHISVREILSDGRKHFDYAV